MVVDGWSESELYRVRSSVFSYSLYALWVGYRVLYTESSRESRGKVYRKYTEKGRESRGNLYVEYVVC